MLIEQHPYIDEQGNEHENLVKHYSDAGFYILQNETGVKYSEAVDIYPCRYTYTETDEPIDDRVEEVAEIDDPTPPED